jgi:hypothetical protein
MQENISTLPHHHEYEYAGENLKEHVRGPSRTGALRKMILIVRGHISSRDAKYAITLWEKFESGLARSYARGVAN